MCAMERAESALTRARIPAVHLTGEPIGPQENFAMRAIDRTLVDEVWRELTAYAPARVASEAQAFLDLQPHGAGEPLLPAQDADRRARPRPRRRLTSPNYSRDNATLTLPSPSPREKDSFCSLAPEGGEGRVRGRPGCGPHS